MKRITYCLLVFIIVTFLSGCLGLITGEWDYLFDFSGISETQIYKPEPGEKWDRVRQVEAPVITMEPDSKLFKLSEQVKKRPEKYLPLLVEELVSASDDEFYKVKAIHDWIALNISYDADAFLKDSPVAVDTYGVLHNGASVCAGYANLFTSMCNLANIQSVVISGHARGSDWSPYRELKEGFESNHAWNAVEIEEEWYLIDCTWDAGYLMDDKFKHNYETGYFCTPPAGFLHTHFPENPAWQLIDEPLKFSEFHELPYLNGIFFTWGLSAEPELCVINQVDDQAVVSFRVPADVSVSGIVIDKDNEFGSTPGCMKKRVGEYEKIFMIFPHPGNFYISLTAKREREQGSEQLSKPIGLVYFEAASGSDKTYPYFSEEFNNYDIQVESPVLPYNPEVEEPPVITLSTKGDVEIEVMLFEESGEVFTQPLQNRVFIRRSGSRIQIYLSFPKKGEYSVTIFQKTPSDSGSWTLTQLMKFPLKALKKSDYEFPRIDPGHNVSIIKPMYSPLKSGTEVDFEVYAPGQKKVFIRINNKYNELNKDASGRFLGRFKVAGEKVALYYEKKANYYILIAEYDVR